MRSSGYGSRSKDKDDGNGKGRIESIGKEKGRATGGSPPMLCNGDETRTEKESLRLHSLIADSYEHMGQEKGVPRRSVIRPDRPSYKA